MSIYSTTDHRKIYEAFIGPIPKDEDGRSYEIHHIDGNHSNNNITNLKCVTITEHFDIHYEQEDWSACLLIADRMKLTKEDYKKLGEMQRGENNHSYDKTIYTFYHKDGIIETSTQFQLRTKYNLKATNLSEVIHGNQKSTKGWRITAEEKPNLTGKLQPGCNDVYIFEHISGITEHLLTQRQLYLKYKLPCRNGISQIVSGKIKSYKGWRVIRKY